MVVADAGRNDWILCQITSNPYGDPRAIRLVNESFDEGLLRGASFARPGKLFTANQELMIAKAGTLKIGPFEQIVEAIMSILRNSLRQ